MKNNVFDEVVGWIGMSIILFAYILISFGVLMPSSVLYQFINIIGSTGILYISFKKKAYQPALLNLIWIIVALVAILAIII
ncbi:MAG TPA: hypothetical protein PLX15_01430 [Candidatus Woesearchaeota archaeon]|jgi:hypothetical protein|nr:hypothetical protein [Candidatus Woesearchaeota archaeon]